MESDRLKSRSTFLRQRDKAKEEQAQAYRGIIPADRWIEPYMSRKELQHQIDEGVVFWGSEETGQLRNCLELRDPEPDCPDPVRSQGSVAPAAKRRHRARAESNRYKH